MTVTKHVGLELMSSSSQYIGNIECTCFFLNDLKSVTFPEDSLELEN